MEPETEDTSLRDVRAPLRARARAAQVDASINRFAAYAAFERLAAAAFGDCVEVSYEDRRSWTRGDDKEALRLWQGGKRVMFSHLSRGS